MSLLSNNLVALRAVEPSDLDSLYKWENITEFWGVGATLTPFSRHTLSLFIDSQGDDIYTSKQVRFMVDTLDGECVGMVDIFDFDPYHLRAGVGVFISSEYQRRGYAKAALEIVIRYAAEVLNLRQLWCGVAADNVASLALFTSVGFIRRGVRTEWIRTSPTTFVDEVMFSLIIE
ncbi:MAG: GNAT family protein [Rikenellaceae bacterium]